MNTLTDSTLTWDGVWLSFYAFGHYISIDPWAWGFAIVGFIALTIYGTRIR